MILTFTEKSTSLNGFTESYYAYTTYIKQDQGSIGFLTQIKHLFQTTLNKLSLMISESKQ